MGNIKIVKLKEDRNDDLLMELNKDYMLWGGEPDFMMPVTN